ncbi:MAG: hypothetical protein RR475_10750 [Clostridia bacterium]
MQIQPACPPDHASAHKAPSLTGCFEMITAVQAIARVRITGNPMFGTGANANRPYTFDFIRHVEYTFL